MPALLPNARNLIMTNARKILAADGFENFKMRKLAKECGMGLGTLYNYYVTKIALVYDLVDEDWTAACKSMRGAAQESTTLVGALESIFAPLAQFAVQNMDLWVNAILAGPLTLGDMGAGRYSPEKYYRDLYNIIRTVILSHCPEYQDLEFTCRFIAINMCRYAAESKGNYKSIGAVFAKLFAEVK